MLDCVFNRSAERQQAVRKTSSLWRKLSEAKVESRACLPPADRTIDIVNPFDEPPPKPKLRGILKRVPFGEVAGLLEIGPPEPINLRGDRYQVHCRCGVPAMLTAKEILYRIKTGIGCGRLACTASHISHQVLRCPDTAIELQVSLLLSICPEDLESFWGGTVDDAYEVHPGVGLSNFRNYVRNLIDPAKGKWWVHKVNDNLPYLEGNIEMKASPARIFKHIHRALIPIEGGSISFAELNEMSTLSTDDLICYIGLRPGQEIDLDQLI